MMDSSLTIGTVCFIIDKNSRKVLLLNRSNEPMKNMLTGVGGKTRFDEDISQSCIREVKEETGFDVIDLKLSGVLKTIAEDRKSSWILFVYSTYDFEGKQINCDEGELKWVNIDEIYNVNLIGFIREILPFVMEEKNVFEGTIIHNSVGEVLESNL
jgi:8-oxo-dGTP diphosphatase